MGVLALQIILHKQAVSNEMRLGLSAAASGKREMAVRKVVALAPTPSSVKRAWEKPVFG